MSKRGFLGQWLLPYLCLVAIAGGVWLFLFSIDSCLLGGDVLDVYICMGTGRALAVEFAPDVAIALALIMALFWLLNTFRPSTRVSVGFIACLIFMVPLTVTIGFLRAAYFPPTLVGTITSLPLNHYVVITDTSGRPAVVYVEHDEEMATLLVGDKIAVTMIEPVTPKHTIQTEWSQRSSFISVESLPPQLRDLPGSTPFVIALRVKVRSKSPASQPTQWVPIASLDDSGEHDVDNYFRAPPFSIRTDRWRMRWTATLTHPDTSGDNRLSVSILRIPESTDLHFPTSVGGIDHPLRSGETARGTFLGYGAGTFYAGRSGHNGLRVRWQYVVEELR